MPEPVANFSSGNLYPHDLASEEAFSKWIEEKQHGHDAVAFLCESYEGKPCHALRIIDSLCRYNFREERRVQIAALVVTAVPLRELIIRAIEYGLPNCPDAVRLLRKVDQRPTDKYLNLFVLKQLDVDPLKAKENIAFMLKAKIPITAGIVLRLIEHSPERNRDLINEILSKNPSLKTDPQVIEAKKKIPPPPKKSVADKILAVVSGIRPKIGEPRQR
jgi:hypothetical protein